MLYARYYSRDVSVNKRDKNLCPSGVDILLSTQHNGRCSKHIY